MSKYVDRKSINGIAYARVANTRVFGSFIDSGLTYEEYWALPETPTFSPAAWGLDEREINGFLWNKAGTKIIGEIKRLTIIDYYDKSPGAER